MEAIVIGNQRYVDVRAALVEAGRLYSVVCMSRTNYQEACAELGRALITIKAAVEQGQWLRALAMAGIHAKTAQRAMRLAEARAAGLKVGLHAAPALRPEKANTSDHRSHEASNRMAKARDTSVACVDEFEAIVNPEYVAAARAEMEGGMGFEDEDFEDDDLEGNDEGGDEELDDLPAEGDDIEDAAGEVVGASGEQLSLVSVWEELARAGEMAHALAQDASKARRVADAVRRFEEEIEAIRAA